MKFFPYRTDAHVRVSKRYSVIAGFVILTFNKMDLVFHTEFDFA